MVETFTPLIVGSGLPDGEAVLEQCAGLVCLYWGDEIAAQSLLDICGGGQILYWFFDPQNPIPAIAFLRQGNHYYAWVAGSVNASHWIGNVQGFLTPAGWSPGVLVHSFFANLAAQLLAGGESHLPPAGSNVRFTLVGHSLGGAIAQIIAIALGDRYGPDNVELLTFGQPKAFTLGLDGDSLWPTYIRIRVPNDPVPMVPPDRGLSWFLSLGLPQAAISAVFEWTHYGTPYMLGAGGTLTPDLGLPFWQNFPGQWLTSINIQAHYIKNIAALLGVE